MFQPSAVNCLQPSILAYFPGLKARIESRENWMPAKNGRHDGARIAAPSPPPSGISRSLRSLFLSHVEKQSNNPQCRGSRLFLKLSIFRVALHEA